jgi:pimeloyl-ACP methyl ester carboxylesterase
VAKLNSNGLSLEYETFGEASSPAVILIAGLGFQLIDWPEDFCIQIANKGFFVLRFDNRDVGLSQKLEEKGVPDLVRVISQLQAGKNPEVPYHLTDMAGDVHGLLDALEIEQAHIVGMSMGGMIAQLMAIFYPEKVFSLTSIMSSSGARHLPPPSAAANTVLMKAPESNDLEDVIAFGMEVNDVIGSPGFRWNHDELKDHVRACVERCYCPEGYLRQYTAVQSSSSRTRELPNITAPTLVIHGLDDLLVSHEAGEDTARLIPNARLELVKGMGHDLSPALCNHLLTLILPHLTSV